MPADGEVRTYSANNLCRFTAKAGPCLMRNPACDPAGGREHGRPVSGDSVMTVVPLDFLEAALGKEHLVEVQRVLQRSQFTTGLLTLHSCRVLMIPLVTARW